MHQNMKHLFAELGNWKLVANSKILDQTQIESVAQFAVDAVQSRLTAVSDFGVAGMVTDSNDLSNLYYVYNKLSDIQIPDISMMISTKAQRDALSFTTTRLPIPVISKQFTINMRQMASSASTSHNSIDIHKESLRAASYAVGWGMEDLLFNGAPNLKTYDADPLHGLRTHPNKMNFTITGNSSGWSASSGADIIGDTLKMVKLFNDNNIYDRIMMYIAPNLVSVLEGDYSTAKGDKTFKERIIAVSGIIDVRATGALPDNEVVLVHMDPMSAEIQTAMQPNIIEYSADGNINYNYVVFAAMCPILKFDINNKGGILHAVTS